MEFYRFGPLLGKTIIKEELRLELLETGIIQTMDARKALVGHIENEKEYSIELRKKIEPKIMEYIDDYIQSASNEKNLIKSKYKSILNSLWINRQTESEHNPPHSHKGGQISFVIYLDFPKEIQTAPSNGLIGRAWFPRGIVEKGRIYLSDDRGAYEAIQNEDSEENEDATVLKTESFSNEKIQQDDEKETVPIKKRIIKNDRFKIQ
jgi:hypothetical protein